MYVIWFSDSALIYGDDRELWLSNLAVINFVVIYLEYTSIVMRVTKV